MADHSALLVQNEVVTAVLQALSHIASLRSTLSSSTLNDISDAASIMLSARQKVLAAGGDAVSSITDNIRVFSTASYGGDIADGMTSLPLSAYEIAMGVKNTTDCIFSGAFDTYSIFGITLLENMAFVKNTSSQPVQIEVRDDSGENGGRKLIGSDARIIRVQLPVFNETHYIDRNITTGVVSCIITSSEEEYVVPVDCPATDQPGGVSATTQFVSCPGDRSVVVSYTCPYVASFPQCVSYNGAAYELDDNCAVVRYTSTSVTCECFVWNTDSDRLRRRRRATGHSSPYIANLATRKVEVSDGFHTSETSEPREYQGGRSPVVVLCIVTVFAGGMIYSLFTLLTTPSPMYKKVKSPPPRNEKYVSEEELPLPPPPTFFDVALPVEFSDMTWVRRYGLKLLEKHVLVGSFSDTGDSLLNATKLFTSIVTLIFVNTVYARVFYDDYGHCGEYQEYDCTHRTRSRVFGYSYSSCEWSERDMYCVYNPPVASYIAIVVLTGIVLFTAIPLNGMVYHTIDKLFAYRVALVEHQSGCEKPARNVDVRKVYIASDPNHGAVNRSGTDDMPDEVETGRSLQGHDRLSDELMLWQTTKSKLAVGFRLTILRRYVDTAFKSRGKRRTSIFAARDDQDAAIVTNQFDSTSEKLEALFKTAEAEESAGLSTIDQQVSADMDALLQSVRQKSSLLDTLMKELNVENADSDTASPVKSSSGGRPGTPMVKPMGSQHGKSKMLPESEMLPINEDSSEQSVTNSDVLTDDRGKFIPDSAMIIPLQGRKGAVSASVANHESVHIIQAIREIENEDYKQLVLFHYFLVNSLPPGKRNIASKYFTQSDRFNRYRRSDHTGYCYFVLAIFAYCAIALMYSFWFGVRMESHAVRVWYITLSLAVCQKLFIVDPLLLFVTYVIVPLTIRSDVLRVHRRLRDKGPTIMSRCCLHVRPRNSKVQYLNPACVAARQIPEYPLSRLLIQLNDYDIPAVFKPRNIYKQMLFIVFCGVLVVTTMLPPMLHYMLMEVVLSPCISYIIILIYNLHDMKVSLPVAIGVGVGTFILIVIYLECRRPRRGTASVDVQDHCSVVSNVDVRSHQSIVSQISGSQAPLSRQFSSISGQPQEETPPVRNTRRKPVSDDDEVDEEEDAAIQRDVSSFQPPPCTPDVTHGPAAAAALSVHSAMSDHASFTNDDAAHLSQYEQEETPEQVAARIEADLSQYEQEETPEQVAARIEAEQLAEEAEQEAEMLELDRLCAEAEVNDHAQTIVEGVSLSLLEEIVREVYSAVQEDIAQREAARKAAAEEAALLAAEREAARAEITAAREAAEEAKRERVRLLAEMEAVREETRLEAARVAAEIEAARVAADQATRRNFIRMASGDAVHDATRAALERETDRLSREKEATRRAAEEARLETERMAVIEAAREAARLAAKEEAVRVAAEKSAASEEEAARDARVAAARAAQLHGKDMEDADKDAARLAADKKDIQLDASQQERLYADRLTAEAVVNEGADLLIDAVCALLTNELANELFTAAREDAARREAERQFVENKSLPVFTPSKFNLLRQECNGDNSVVVERPVISAVTSLYRSGSVVHSDVEEEEEEADDEQVIVYCSGDERNTFGADRSCADILVTSDGTGLEKGPLQTLDSSDFSFDDSSSLMEQRNDSETGKYHGVDSVDNVSDSGHSKSEAKKHRRRFQRDYDTRQHHQKTRNMVREMSKEIDLLYRGESFGEANSQPSPDDLDGEHNKSFVGNSGTGGTTGARRRQLTAKQRQKSSPGIMDDEYDEEEEEKRRERRKKRHDPLMEKIVVGGSGDSPLRKSVSRGVSLHDSESLIGGSKNDGKSVPKLNWSKKA